MYLMNKNLPRRWELKTGIEFQHILGATSLRIPGNTRLGFLVPDIPIGELWYLSNKLIPEPGDILYIPGHRSEMNSQDTHDRGLATIKSILRHLKKDGDIFISFWEVNKTYNLEHLIDLQELYVDCLKNDTWARAHSTPLHFLQERRDG